jgi:hypothetical protein
MILADLVNLALWLDMYSSQVFLQQEKIYQETKKLTIAEELVYWQKQTKELQQRRSKKSAG